MMSHDKWAAVTSRKAGDHNVPKTTYQSISYLRNTAPQNYFVYVTPYCNEAPNKWDVL